MLSNWRSPPRPGAKSPEQGRPYNRRHREVGRRREGGGWVRSPHFARCLGTESSCWIRTSGTAAQKPWISAAFLGLRRHRRAPKRYPPDGSGLLLLRTTGQKRRQIRPTSARGRGQEAPVSKRDRIRLLTARGLLVENGTRPQRITSKLRSSALVS